MGYVVNKLTPVRREDMAKAVTAAYRKVNNGKGPSREILQAILAKIDHEVGDGNPNNPLLPNLHNYSIGNARGVGSTGLWTSFAQREVDDAGNSYMAPVDTSESSKNKTKAYASLQDGADDYMRLIKSRPNWWNGLQTGTLKGFIDGLAKRPMAYFTDDPAKYLASVQKRYPQWTALALQYSSAVTLGVVGAVVISVLTFFGVRYLRG